MRINCAGIFVIMAFSLLGTAGCTNDPGALKLTMTCPPAISSSQAIAAKMNLVAGREPVCLCKGYYFDYQLQEVGNDRPAIKTNPRAYCGMAALALMPVFPVVVAAGWIDMADVRSRFIVIPSNGNEAETFTLRNTEYGIWASRVSSPGSHQVTAKVNPWPPGKYKLTATLVNSPDQPTGVGGPPPLFWKPYDQPVTAETSLEIVP